MTIVRGKDQVKEFALGATRSTARVKNPSPAVGAANEGRSSSVPAQAANTHGGVRVSARARGLLSSLVGTASILVMWGAVKI